MITKCNGCGRTDLSTAAFRCVWPDGRTVIERYCDECRLIWRRQLELLGASLERIDAPDVPALRLE
jgi:hypothetical protein